MRLFGVYVSRKDPNQAVATAFKLGVRAGLVARPDGSATTARQSGPDAAIVGLPPGWRADG